MECIRLKTCVKHMLVVARFAGDRIIGPLPVDILGWCLQELDQTPIVGRTSRWLALLAGASLLKKGIADLAGALFEKMSSEKNGMTAWLCLTDSDGNGGVWESFHWKTPSTDPQTSEFTFGPSDLSDWRQVELELEHYGLLMEGGSWTFAFGLKNGSTVHYRGDAPRLFCKIFAWAFQPVSFLFQSLFFVFPFVLEVVFPKKKTKHRNPKMKVWFRWISFLFGGDFQVNQTVCFRGSRQQPGAIFKQFACHGHILHSLKPVRPFFVVEHFSLF